MLAAAGVRPKRRHGQHFLIDGNLMRRLVDSAGIHATDIVLEVGAGTGSLTGLLAQRAGTVVAVEVDRALHAIAARTLAQAANLMLLRADVLDSKSRIARTVVNALTTACRQTTGQLLLVANLPYDVATPLLMNLLLAPLSVRRLCFTVQKEVGERLEAAPESKAYGPLAIILQTVCRVKRTARVPATAFWPMPRVESSMYRLDVVEHPFADHGQLLSFAALVRAAFCHRRKTLRYNLTRCVGPTACGAAAEVVDLGCRPEAVTPGQWVEINRVISAARAP